MRRVVRAVAAGVVCAAVLVVALYLYALARVADEGARPVPARADAAVVLGAAVWPGPRPSPTLARRALAAAELFHRGRVRWVCTTGGVGRTPPAEGVAAAEYLATSAGVPQRALLAESASHTTLENLAGAAPLLRARNIHTLFIVSDGYHLARGVRMARDQGFDAWGIAADGSVRASLDAHPGRWHSEARLLALYTLARPFVRVVEWFERDRTRAHTGRGREK